MDESLAVSFANTRYAQRGEPVDLLATVRGLHGWLSDHDLPGRVTAGDVAAFQQLREATRDVLAALTTEATLPRADVEALNRAAASAPMWLELVLPRSTDADVRVEQRSAADAVAQARARLAGSVIELVTGDRRAGVRACGGPGCVMFFEQTRQRRVWCSAGCGNRARVARHYERTSAVRTPSRGPR
jgi:predicted RNA-binding Zn ribbon-like protein